MADNLDSLLHGMEELDALPPNPVQGITTTAYLLDNELTGDFEPAKPLTPENATDSNNNQNEGLQVTSPENLSIPGIHQQLQEHKATTGRS